MHIMDIPLQGISAFLKAKKLGKYTCPEKNQGKYTYPKKSGQVYLP